ncbi:terpene cyclase/mutase family protein [Bremerella sp. JC770]|uniref:terpene cyclase/mutase family protein n=1 Tax=Bremerella sp. JC770 TaxID=3232137 RepID=UPI00345907F0
MMDGSSSLARDRRPDGDAATGNRNSPTLSTAMERTSNWLLSQQASEGYWCAELEGDSILQSEFLLLLAWAGREQSDIAKRVSKKLLEQQRDDGTWAQYPEAKIDISSSVKAYFALKLTGHQASADYMVKARDAILEAGGADAVNSFTRLYLALLGQIPMEICPAIPPEMILLPNWFPLNIYRMSSWSRTIFIPLAICWALRPVVDRSDECSIQELFIKQPHQWPELRCPGQEKAKGLFTWDRFFRTADAGLKQLEKLRLRPLRARALKLCEKWILDRMPKSDGLGAIFPPILWSIVAFKALGYDDNDPAVQFCWDEIDKLMLHDDEAETTRIQPCKSPVWDTTITLRALAAARHGADEPRMRKALDWMLAKEVRDSGDWTNNVRCEPGGWYFEFNNEFYPDLDDTAMALMALQEQLAECGVSLEVHPGQSWENTTIVTTSNKVSADDAVSQAMLLDKVSGATKRALAWSAEMQNHDGGWGAFDKNNDAEFLCKVPFADHNAMIDPSWPDLSARVIEAYGLLGVTQSSRGKLGDVVRKAVTYIRDNQHQDGSWFGRWGVNYVYGTWQCLVGLTAVGIPTDDEAVQRGAQWLIDTQQQCGAWGETCDSYENPNLKGIGTPTPSQTAWALLGLIAAGHEDSDAVRKGITYLLSTQKEDGTWDEEPYTGTGFPQVFYLRYHYYRIYFPLLALATWAKKSSETKEGSR